MAAELPLREALEGRREVLGDRHPDTLISIGNVVDLLRERNKLDEARAVLGMGGGGQGGVMNHLITLLTEAKAARLAHAAASTDPAGAAQLCDVVARMEEVDARRVAPGDGQICGGAARPHPGAYCQEGVRRCKRVKKV